MLGSIWAFPLTLAGFILARVTGSKYLRTEGGARLYVAGAWFQRAFFWRFNIAAFTWGQTIVVAGEFGIRWGAQTIRHELVHFRQAKRWGILLPFAYGIAALIAWANGGSPYADNYFEVQARKESGQ